LYTSPNFSPMASGLPCSVRRERYGGLMEHSNFVITGRYTGNPS
jgi:hypothetical protein